MVALGASAGGAVAWPIFCTRRSERRLHVCGSVECGRWCDGDGRWRTVSEGRVRPSRVVVDAPLFDDHLGFLKAVEDLAIEAFIPELAVEGLAVAVLPG